MAPDAFPTARMWNAHTPAPMRHSRSPGPIPAPVQVSRNSPGTASAIPAHVTAGVVCPNSRPATGTSTM